MLKHYFRIFFVSLFFVGCTVDAPVVESSKIEALAYLLASLDRQIPQSESEQLAKDIFYKTEQLTKEFELISPPQFHNFLVTVGIREKGLCYHWSDALYLYLSEKKYDSFEFHLMVANIGEYFYEHNALIVVAKDGEIEEGIIIDPWRDSGELYFSTMKNDPEYLWQHRPSRGCR
jgi:hypothetical protein